MSPAIKDPPWAKYEPCFSTRVQGCVILAVCQDHNYYVRTYRPNLHAVAKSTAVPFFSQGTDTESEVYIQNPTAMERETKEAEKGDNSKEKDQDDA